MTTNDDDKGVSPADVNATLIATCVALSSAEGTKREMRETFLRIAPLVNSLGVSPEHAYHHALDAISALEFLARDLRWHAQRVDDLAGEMACLAHMFASSDCRAEFVKLCMPELIA